ncbi:MAG: flagellar hook capping FlgD N-terminal domain-containing protein [Myxococcota bacterium]
MTSLTDIANLGGGNPSVGSVTSGTEELVNSQQFLELLVAQIQNQNPLEPLDGTEYVTQLAEFANLEQITQVNDGIDVLGGGIGAQISQAYINMLGRDVTFTGNDVILDADGRTEIVYALQDTASDLTLTLFDENELPVGQVTGAPRAAGLNTFDWDGTVQQNGETIVLEPGSYTFRLSAQDAAGETVTGQTFGSGRVTGVTYENGGQPELIIGDRRLSPAQVIKVVEPTGDREGN